MLPWLLSFALSSVAVAGGPAIPDVTLRPVGWSVNDRDFCFASGMRVLVEQDATRPIVTVVAAYEGGSLQDPDGREGLAHLAEHAWFRSRRGGTGDVATTLEALGATWNAHTAGLLTTFETSAPREALPALLRLEARRLRQPFAGIAPETLAVERGVLESERHLTRPVAEVLLPTLARALYPSDHPYARERAATRASVDAVDLPALEAWAAERWRPSEATLAIAGDVDPDAVVALLAPIFGDLLGTGADAACPARAPAAPPPPPDPPKADEELPTLSVPIAEPVVVVAWTLPGGYGPQVELYGMAARVLEVQSEAPISCAVDVEPLASTLSCLAPVTSGKGGNTRRLVLSAAESLRLPGMYYSPEVLDRAWASQRAGVIESARDATVPWQLREVAVHLHESGSPRWIADHLGWMDAMALDDLPALFKTSLRPSRAVAVLLEPEADAPPPVASTERTSIQEAPTAPPALTVADLEARVGAPTLDVAEATLPNGLRVVAARYGAAPRVRAALLFPTGDAWSPAPGVDLASWLALVAWRDPDLRQAPVPAQGLWTPERTVLGRELGLSLSSGNLDDGLKLLEIQASTLWTDASDRRVWAAAFADSLEDASAADRAERLAWRSLLADPPFPLDVEPEDLAALRTLRSSVLAPWNERVHQPGNATLLLFGNLVPAAAVASAQAAFAGWEPGEGEAPRLMGASALAPPGRSVTFAQDDRARSVGVSLRCPLPAGAVGDVLTEVLRAWAFRELRTERGLSYGAQATTVRPAVGRTFLTLRIPVEPGTGGEVTRSLLDHLDHPGWTAADVDRARADAARTRSAELASADGWYGALRDALLAGGSASDVGSWPAAAAAVGLPEVLAAGEDCAAHVAITVTGTASEGEALTAAGVAWAAVP